MQGLNYGAPLVGLDSRRNSSLKLIREPITAMITSDFLHEVLTQTWFTYLRERSSTFGVRTVDDKLQERKR